MKEIITAAILLILAVGAFVVSARSFKEKGFVFNNAWLYASEQERGAMDKKPQYRQSAVVFLMAGIVLLLSAAEELLHSGWLFYAQLAGIVLLVVYAIVSGIRIEKKGGRV